MGRNSIPDDKRRKKRTLYCTDVEYALIVDTLSRQRNEPIQHSVRSSVKHGVKDGVINRSIAQDTTLLSAAMVESMPEDTDRYTPILKEKERKGTHRVKQTIDPDFPEDF